MCEQFDESSKGECEQVFLSFNKSLFQTIGSVCVLQVNFGNLIAFKLN